MKKTKKAYEAFMNEFYGEYILDHEHAQKVFGHMPKTQPKKMFGNYIHPLVIKHYNKKTLGTFMRKHAPVEFHTGFNDWNPNA